MKKSFPFFTLCLLIFTICSYAQTGTLDSSFGQNGKAATAIKTSEVYGACRQYDDKILQTGVYFDDNDPKNQILLVRYNKDGGIDTKFGDSGVVATYLDTALFYNTGYGYNVNATKDGSIFVTAKTKPKSGSLQDAIVVIKYDATGTIDSSFGINGLAVYQFYDDNYYFGLLLVNTTIIQPDGSILVNGFVRPDGESGVSYIFVVRYTKEGKADKNFGDNGMVKIQPNKSANYDHGMILRGDGKIVLSVFSDADINPGDLFIRLNPDGSFDKDFGADGIVNTSQDFYTAHICQQNVNKILVTGQGNIKASLITARYNEDGSIDNSFGINGRTTTNIGNNLRATPADIATDNNNRILVCGAADKINIPSDFLLVRYKPDGTLDSAFAVNGIQLTDFSNGEENVSYDRAQTVVIQSSGGIVVSGSVVNNTPYLGLARYNGSQTQPRIARIKRWIMNHTLHFQNPGEDANTAYYVIEKSNNQSSGFVPIAKINAGQEEYSFALTSVSSNYTTEKKSQSFYRIKVVNKDNSFAYTQPISSTDDNTGTINISPNPANSVLNISGLNSNVHYQISVTNKYGKLVLNSIKCAPSANTYSLNISSLEAGIYFIRINDENRIVENLKFMKH